MWAGCLDALRGDAPGPLRADFGWIGCAAELSALLFRSSWSACRIVLT
ncbi:hypothetical protein SynNOUM97013_02315 [Synechococcus sp. NOUM97013]|nr:hypothetical protein SynNOUM97013_02315 [Synechococcus sp. NOUM97013]